MVDHNKAFKMMIKMNNKAKNRIIPKYNLQKKVKMNL